MLELVTMQVGGEKEFTTTWEYGDPLPKVSRDFILYGLRASGREFEFVARLFPAWAPVGGKVAYWHGDLAKTILGTLQLMSKQASEENEIIDKGEQGEKSDNEDVQVQLRSLADQS